MLTTCDERNNHALRPAAPRTAVSDGGLLNHLLLGARTINIQSLAETRREKEDDDTSSLNSDADQDHRDQDFTIDHPNDRHAEYDDVCNIINSVLEMIEDDDFFQ